MYARRKNWWNIGQDYFAADIAEPRRGSKNGNFVSGEWISDTDPTLEQIEQRANGEEHTDSTREQTEKQPNPEEQ